LLAQHHLRSVVGGMCQAAEQHTASHQSAAQLSAHRAQTTTEKAGAA
jgi:hypothetical protein